MSQPAKPTRVRQLAGSIWPGRTVNGYANLIAARLRKLADDRSTGLLPVSGGSEGAVFFRDGHVVYAESSRTFRPALRATGQAAFALTSPDVPGIPGEDPPAAVPGSVSGLARALDLTELIVDALTELLSSESRYAKFRPSEALAAGRGRPIAVEALLPEVQRRHEVRRQLASVVTPDTAITAQPSIDRPSAQVLPMQWAFLRRAGDGATPRRIALQQGWSVFGTTIEAYRLVKLGLLVAPGYPSAGGSEQPAVGLSFIRAVSGGRGIDAQRTHGD